MKMQYNCYDSELHEDIVNNAEWTHNFQDIATEDNEQEMIALFEAEIDFDTVDDLVGLNVYFKRGEIVAYYDYENATGSNKLSKVDELA
jgi:hypothetical protein